MSTVIHMIAPLARQTNWPKARHSHCPEAVSNEIPLPFFHGACSHWAQIFRYPAHGKASVFLNPDGACISFVMKSIFFRADALRPCKRLRWQLPTLAFLCRSFFHKRRCSNRQKRSWASCQGCKPYLRWNTVSLCHRSKENYVQTLVSRHDDVPLVGRSVIKLVGPAVPLALPMRRWRFC